VVFFVPRVRGSRTLDPCEVFTGGHSLQRIEALARDILALQKLRLEAQECLPFGLEMDCRASCSTRNSIRVVAICRNYHACLSST
jgi:hypothetical protein